MVLAAWLAGEVHIRLDEGPKHEKVLDCLCCSKAFPEPPSCLRTRRGARGPGGRGRHSGSYENKGECGLQGRQNGAHEFWFHHHMGAPCTCWAAERVNLTCGVVGVCRARDAWIWASSERHAARAGAGRRNSCAGRQQQPAAAERRQAARRSARSCWCRCPGATVSFASVRRLPGRARPRS